MRRLLCFAAVLLILAAPLALAHPGRTDSQGGHYNRSTGKYHFHHGMSAHDHPGDVCPYDDEPVATPKPTKFASVYAYRSDQYANALSVTVRPTAAPARKEPFGKELRMKIIIALGTAVVILAFALVLCAKKLSSLSSEKDSLSHLNQELSKDVKHLNYLHRVFDQLLPFVGSLASEAYLKRLEKPSPISFEHPIGSANPSVEPLMVIVPETKSNKFHLRVHGPWYTNKIPVQEAILKGYHPCSVCCPPLRVYDHKTNPLVWFSDSDSTFYHNSFFCGEKLYPNGISVPEAYLRRSLKPCNVCNPPSPEQQNEIAQLQLKTITKERNELQKKCRNLENEIKWLKDAIDDNKRDRVKTFQSYAALLSKANQHTSDAIKERDELAAQLADLKAQQSDGK